MMRISISSLCITILLSLAFTCNATEYINQQTKEISELAKKYALADEKEKDIVIHKIDRLAKENPDDINTIRIYTSILSSRGEYSKATGILKTFNKNNKIPELYLQECMLKDRIGNYDENCYKKAMAMTDKTTHTSIDLLMILFLTNNKDFKKEKELYIKNTQNIQESDPFDKDKNSFLKEIYPHQPVKSRYK